MSVGEGHALPALLLVAIAVLACAAEEGPPLLELEVTPRGHQEVVLGAGGSVRPLWLGRNRPFELCFDTPLHLDSSQWRGRLSVGGHRPRGGFADPSIVAGTVLCLAAEVPATLAATPELELCATVENSFDGRRLRLPCLVAAFDPDTGALLELRRRAGEAIAARSNTEHLEAVARLDALADEASVAGFPAVEVGLRMVAAGERLRAGGADGLPDAARRFAELPDWLSHPAAARWATRAAYERVELELTRGRLRSAWQRLRVVDGAARKAVAPSRIALMMQEVRILGRVGAGDRARHRLREVVAGCEQMDCRTDLERAAYGLAAWLAVSDPNADPARLEQAALDLEVATGAAEEDPGELANLLINRALLAHRVGQPPGADLAEARSLLSQLEPSARTRMLAGWANVVEGLAALESGELQQALVSCRRAATAAERPRLAAWAWSCLGRAHRARLDLERSEIAFEQALARHELATARELGQDLPLSPGERSDDYLRAARVAVEQGEAERAWRILGRLDRVAGDLLALCRGPEGEARRRLDQRREELLAQLAWTEPPLAPRRREQLEPVRQALRRSLEELQRAMVADCGRAGLADSAPPGPIRPEAAPGLRLRAFALPDELMVLARRGTKEATLLRRSAISRQKLRNGIGQLEVARQERVDDREWRRLSEPLARALLPDDGEGLGPVVRFTLHGALQRLPVAALPVGGAEGDRWFGDLVVPAIQSHGLATRERPGASGAGLFVVDPSRNLPSGAAGAEVYRELFPEAKILFGAAATRGAVEEAIARASFLHVDAHGQYEEAFPQLSGLVMSDGVSTLREIELEELSLGFANLSGCHTGAAAETGDSGRYGLAGALVRRGVPWAIGSRATIEDRASQVFNETFYREIAAGAAVPDAFGSGLAALRRDRPAAVWSRLFLAAGG